MMRLKSIKLFSWVILCLVHCAVGDKQRKAVDAGKVVFSAVDSDSEETYRMINVGSRQQQVTGRGQDKPLVFYSSSNKSYASSLGPRIGRPNQQRPKQIPLSLLRQLNEERDVSGIIDKYVSNIRVKDVGGQRAFVDLDGRVVDINGGGLGGTGPDTTIATSRRPQFKWNFRTSTTTSPPAAIGAPLSGSAFGGGGNQSVPFATTTFALPSPKPGPVFTRTGIIRTSPDRIGPASTAAQVIGNEAKCEPEVKAVPIKGYEERSDVFVHPKCVRIPQCGGCCGSNLLACEAVDTEPVQIVVRIFEYNPEVGKLELTQTEKLQMQAHTKCKCGCRIRAEDCGPNQYYDEHNCKCVCRNEAESYACFDQPNKQWNYEKCQCECYDPGFCERGFFWNSRTCECEFDTEVCARFGGRPSRRNRRRRDQNKLDRNSRNASAPS